MSILVSNWRHGWKWLSVHLMTFGAALQATWIAIPDTMRSFLPDRYAHWIVMSLFISGAIARFINQSGGKSNGPQPPSS